jgi:hypothetical protein
MSRKNKLPKKIAGVKLPKPLRKSGERLLRRVDTPLGRTAVAGGLLAIAGVLAATKQMRMAGGGQVRDAASTTPPISRRVSAP